MINYKKVEYSCKHASAEAWTLDLLFEIVVKNIHVLPLWSLSQ